MADVRQAPDFFSVRCDVGREASPIRTPAAAGFVTGQNFVIDGGMTKKMIYI